MLVEPSAPLLGEELVEAEAVLVEDGPPPGNPEYATSHQQRVVRTSVTTVSFPEHNSCSFLLNVLWIVFGGWQLFLGWAFFGVILCVLIITIPCGIQVFRVAKLMLLPFGKSVVWKEEHRGCCRILLNLVWLVLFGWAAALQLVITGVAFFMTIVGIPFGFQCFKLAQLAVWPFGATIVPSERVETTTTTTTTTTLYHALEGDVEA